MKKTLFVVFTFTLLSFTTYSQILFEKGYYIDNSDKRIECFIKNVGWKNNPSKIEYKIKEEGEAITAAIEAVKEFGIGDLVKYQRFNVLMDRASDADDLSRLSTIKEPEFKEELLLLKVIIEGKATLFAYEEKNLFRYFYSIDGREPAQLVYKRYHDGATTKVRANTDYRKQLYTDVNCEKQPIQNLGAVRYIKADLVKIVTQYNDCQNSTSINFDKKPERDKFNLNAKVGANMSGLSFSLDNTVYTVGRLVEFDNTITYSFGVEGEYILPFNKNKWALIAEAMYHYFNGETEAIIGGLVPRTLDATVNYASIEIPIGIRHYFYLNEKSKLFLNASFIFDVAFEGNTLVFPASPATDIDLKTGNGFYLGGGYNLNNELSAELRYGFPRILTNRLPWFSDYQKLSLIVGYNLF